MKIIVTTADTTDLSSEEVFRIWSDVTHWPSWNHPITWAKLYGPFRAGRHGMLQYGARRRRHFWLASVVPNESFVMIVRLPGAKLHYNNSLGRQGSKTIINQRIHITGPWGWWWAMRLGPLLQTSTRTTIKHLLRRAVNN